MKPTVGVWGCGVVGGNTAKLFKYRSDNEVEVLMYDKYKNGNWVTPEEMVLLSDFIFICLPTPMKDSGEIDLSYIDAAIGEIDRLAHQMRNNKPIVIIRSTSVSGSSDQYAEICPHLEIAFMPEFLTEANPWEDTLNATRVVIGTSNTLTFFTIRSLFWLVYGTKVEYIPMTRSEAEMYKYACNYLLSMSVLAANELYFICKAVGIDYQVIQKNLKYDSRIGTFTVVPGPDGDFGVGGKCLIPSTTVRLKGDTLTTLEDVQEGDLIFDGKGYTEVTKKGERFVNEMLELKARGRTVTGSVDHIQVVFEDGKYKEKMLKDINLAKDKLFVPMQPKIKRDVINIGPVPNTNHRTVWHEKINMNHEIARLIGLYLADGCMSGHDTIWTFGEHNEHFADEVVETLQQEFGIHSRKFFQVSNGTYGESRCWRVDTCNRWLQAFFSVVGTGKNALSKNVCLFSDSIAKSLIGGWLDGDGYSQKNAISGYSRSTNFIKSIDTMLLSVGINGMLGRGGEEIGVSMRKDVAEVSSWTTRHTKYNEDNYVRKNSYASPTCKPFAYKDMDGWLVDIVSITKKEGGRVISLETKSGLYVANNIQTHNCFPKDINALAHLAKVKGYTPDLLDMAIDFNLRIRTNRDWLEIPGAVSDCEFKEGE